MMLEKCAYLILELLKLQVKVQMLALLLTVFVLVAASVSAEPSKNCPEFNAKDIKLVTFDVFAALMDLDSEL